MWEKVSRTLIEVYIYWGMILFNRVLVYWLFYYTFNLITKLSLNKSNYFLAFLYLGSPIMFVEDNMTFVEVLGFHSSEGRFVYHVNIGNTNQRFGAVCSLCLNVTWCKT
jgi:hypothetical protein